MDAKLRASLPASVCGKRFYPRALRIIRETISEYEPCSRKEITRQVCDRLGWVDHRGQRKEMGAAGCVAAISPQRLDRTSASPQHPQSDFAHPTTTGWVSRTGADSGRSVERLGQDYASAGDGSKGFTVVERANFSLPLSRLCAFMRFPDSLFDGNAGPGAGRPKLLRGGGDTA